MIYLGADHNGFDLKQEIARALRAAGEDVSDVGALEADPADDYPNYAFAVGRAVAEHPGAFGILVCGSAQGVCIAANKVKGVRAAAVFTGEDAVRVRLDDDANVLCLSGWNQTIGDVMPILDGFLKTAFSGEERHLRRIGEITAFENQG